MRAIDPIFVAPRYVQRDWGRRDTGEWCKGHLRPVGPVAEVWTHDAANGTEAGPLGRRLAAASDGMLGDLGRAPPRLRLVFPEKTTTLSSTSPVSLWTVLEPGVAPETDVPATPGEPPPVHRTGERIRAYEGAAVTFAPGSVALEVSAAFQPSNRPPGGPQLVHMPPVSKRMRATLFREDGLSIETWTLPEWSRVAPDGETCHVITALTPGICIDGRRLDPGAAVFLPAWGRPLDITGAGAKLLIAYPDRMPTAIWRHASGPDPAAGQLPRPAPARPPAAAIAGRQASLAA